MKPANHALNLLKLSKIKLPLSSVEGVRYYISAKDKLTNTYIKKIVCCKKLEVIITMSKLKKCISFVMLSTHGVVSRIK